VSRPWVYDAVLHQIYPRSFCDADGVGDLADHLTCLGVDALWTRS
jgi:glycosidase